MKAILYVILLTAASVTGPWLFAAEQPTTPPAAQADKPAEAAAPAAKSPVSDKKAADAAKAETERSAEEEPAAEPAASEKSAADKASAGKNSPQRFIPSEQVRADFDVSFPVDI